MEIEERNGAPLCKIFTVENPIIEFCSENLPNVMKSSFKKLDVSCKKHWSGFEFFGLDKPDVIELCTQHTANENGNQLAGEEKKRCKVDYQSDDIAKAVLDIRHRNAGETSSLKSQKAVANRNLTIHKIVEHVSFGDVPSKGIF